MSNARDRSLKRMEDFLRCRLAEETILSQQSYPPFRPALTISREAGTGVMTVAENLVDYLGQFDETAEQGWALFDQSLVASVIESHHLPASAARYLREDRSGTISGAIEEMLGLHPSRWTLFHYTADTIRKLCALGNAIVIGRAGNFVTSDLPNTFQVRLVGSEQVRLKTISEERHLNAEEARRYLRQTDEARAGYVKQHLKKKIADPAAYHLVLNTDRFSDALTARIIGDTLLEWAAARSAEEQPAVA